MAEAIAHKKGIVNTRGENTRRGGGQAKGIIAHARRYSNYGKTGYNARTC